METRTIVRNVNILDTFWILQFLFIFPCFGKRRRSVDS